MADISKNGKSGKKQDGSAVAREKNLLVFEDGVVSLGGEELPGILVSLSVGGAVRFDDAKKDGMSGAKKSPLGFEDAEISISLNLLSDDESDCYAKLAKINGRFQGLDGKAKPQIYKVFNRHLQARNIETVIFSRLDSDESEEDDMIAVGLEFKEHNPPVIKREKQVLEAKADQAKQNADPTKAAEGQAVVVIDMATNRQTEVTLSDNPVNQPQEKPSEN
jgi:hypothetical protein